MSQCPQDKLFTHMYSTRECLAELYALEDQASQLFLSFLDLDSKFTLEHLQFAFESYYQKHSLKDSLSEFDLAQQDVAKAPKPLQTVLGLLFQLLALYDAETGDNIFAFIEEEYDTLIVPDLKKTLKPSNDESLFDDALIVIKDRRDMVDGFYEGKRVLTDNVGVRRVTVKLSSGGTTSFELNAVMYDTESPATNNIYLEEIDEFYDYDGSSSHLEALMLPELAKQFSTRRLYAPGSEINALLSDGTFKRSTPVLHPHSVNQKASGSIHEGLRLALMAFKFAIENSDTSNSLNIAKESSKPVHSMSTTMDFSETAQKYWQQSRRVSKVGLGAIMATDNIKAFSDTKFMFSVRESLKKFGEFSFDTKVLDVQGEVQEMAFA